MQLGGSACPLLVLRSVKHLVYLHLIVAAAQDSLTCHEFEDPRLEFSLVDLTVTVSVHLLETS